LCVASSISPLQLSRFTGHATVTTTLAIYTHLSDADLATATAALGAMARLTCGGRERDLAAAQLRAMLIYPRF
jgi:hypothetical protein